MNKRLTILFLTAVLFFSFATGVEAEVKAWDFEKWQVDIEIEQDSSFLVREAQTFNFSGNFHWVTRDIAKQRLRKISEIKVFDESGRELTGKEIEITDFENFVMIKLNFDLTDTQKTWVFQYRVHGGLGSFNDYDELYWNAISSDREVRIKNVQVTVYLPEKVSQDEVQQRIYLGSFGSQQTSPDFSFENGDTFKYFGSNILAFENFTVVAGFPKGIIEQAGFVAIESNPVSGKVFVDGKDTGFKTPAVLEQDYDILPGIHRISVKSFGWEDEGKEITFLEGIPNIIAFEMEKTLWLNAVSYVPFLLPLWVLSVLIKRWRKYAKVKKTIIAQYEPPLNLGTLETGALIDSNIQPKDLTAVLIDLAFRGFLKIKEEENKGFFSSKDKYILIKQEKFFTHQDELKKYEKDLCKAIFGHKNEVEINDLQRDRSLFFDLEKIKREIFEKLLKQGYYHKNPQSDKVFSILMIVFIPALGFALLALSTQIFIFLQLLITLVLTELLFVFSLIFSPAPLTEKGAEAKWHALGFKEYLQVAERFRLGACSPETFEKYLSFAVLFGVEEKWADRFADIYKQVPSWFETYHPSFTVINFSSSVSSFSTSFSGVVVSGGASSSSGFGGGGGAGGGGGGGGSGAG